MDLTAAQAELGSRGFDYLSSGRKTIMLNLGKNALEGLYPWPWLEAIATGTGTVTFTDLREVLFVRNTGSDAELMGASREWLRAMFGVDLTDTGTATHWYLDGTTALKVYPTEAAAALSVDYIKWSPELATGTDTPLIPVREHPVWVDFAEVEALKDKRDYAAARDLLGDLMGRQVPRMVDAYLGRNLQNPAQQPLTFASEDW